jgi:hypothetical protein
VIEVSTVSVTELADLVGLSINDLLSKARGFYSNLPLIPPQPTTLLGVDSEPEESRMEVGIAQDLILLLVDEKLIKPVVELSNPLEALAQTKRQVHYQNSATL